MQHDPHEVETAKSTYGIPVLVIAVILGLLAIFLKNSYNPKSDFWASKNGTIHTDAKENTEEMDAAPIYMNPAELGKLDTTSGNFIYNVGNMTKLQLPDSTFINVGENSTEAKLVKFLSDAETKVDTANKTKGWISCDRLFFETGKSTLTAESQNQLQNIAAILKAYPAAALKIGGYTDNTGSLETNKTLSQQRAEAAMASLVKDGSTAEKLNAEGYGQDHPIGDNETAAGKALNRRIDLRVTKK